MRKSKFQYKIGDIVYCQYYDRNIDEYKKVFAFITDRTQERGEWGVDILYCLTIQNGPNNFWIFERDIIKLINRKPYA